MDKDMPQSFTEPKEVTFEHLKENYTFDEIVTKMYEENGLVCPEYDAMVKEDKREARKARIKEVLKTTGGVIGKLLIACCMGLFVVVSATVVGIIKSI